MLFYLQLCLAYLAVAVFAGNQATDLIKSFDKPFEILLQFDKSKYLKGFNLANTLPGSSNEGLIMGLNGSENPGNLAQSWVFRNGSLITSYGAVSYGKRSTVPDDTGYPLAPLTKFQDYNYLQWVPAGNHLQAETRLAFKTNKQYTNYYELCWENGTELNLGFGKLFSFDARVYAVVPPGVTGAKTVKILTGKS